MRFVFKLNAVILLNIFFKNQLFHFWFSFSIHICIGNLEKKPKIKQNKTKKQVLIFYARFQKIQDQLTF